MTSAWESTNPRRQRAAAELVAIQRARFALEAEVSRLKGHVDKLERRCARLEREAREGHATIERLQAALEGR